MRNLSPYFMRHVSLNTYIILLILCVSLLIFYKPDIALKSVSESDIVYPEFRSIIIDHDYHKRIIDLYYDRRKTWKTSNLGSILFKNAEYKQEQDENRTNRTFVVLIWKYFKWLESRHINNFNSKKKGDPLAICSVKNCKFTGNNDDISSADAVVVHIQRGVFPNVTKSTPGQRWIFLSDESPVHSFSMAKSVPKMSDIANVFNWSMTYRSDSDVPVPYGRTVALQEPKYTYLSQDSVASLVPYWKEKRRDVLPTILISNCGVSRRMNYLEELQKYLTVDVYGQCSKNHKNSCPGHFRSDCKVMSEYIFYLVFENSQCQQYLTEKGFYHAYSKGAIPVIMGPRLEDCEKLLPPKSYLHVDNYKSPEELAKHMLQISEEDGNILVYHRWRNNFEVLNEHGYFGSKSYHFCRVCEALNYNDDKEKIYDVNGLRSFLDPALSCR